MAENPKPPDRVPHLTYISSVGESGPLIATNVEPLMHGFQSGQAVWSASSACVPYHGERLACVPRCSPHESIRLSRIQNTSCDASQGVVISPASYLTVFEFIILSHKLSEVLIGPASAGNIRVVLVLHQFLNALPCCGARSGTVKSSCPIISCSSSRRVAAAAGCPRSWCVKRALAGSIIICTKEEIEHLHSWC